MKALAVRWGYVAALALLAVGFVIALWTKCPW